MTRSLTGDGKRAGAPATVPVCREVVDAEALLSRLEAALASGQRGHSRVDGLALVAVAVRAARGTGRVEVALGEGLEALRRRNGLMRLGRSGVGDLGREDLGLSEGYARRLRRNADKLRSRPALRAAILSGEVTSRKAEVVLDRTPAGEDAYWAARAKVDTVRALEAATRAGGRRGEEDWQRIELSLSPSQQAIWRAGMEQARILLGGAASPVRQVEVMLMEFLGACPVPVGEGPATTTSHCSLRANEEVDEDRPADVGCAPALAVASSPFAEGPFDPHAMLASLKALVAQRAATDEQLRRACLLVKELGAQRWTGFHTFSVWCTEGLGLSPRTVRQLVALERRLQALPPLRDAVRAGTLTLEQARQVARNATAADVGRRIAEAASRPAIDTRRLAEVEEEERRMWDAGKVRLSLLESVALLFRDALASGLQRFPRATPGEIMTRIAAHFVLTWASEVTRLLREAGPAMRRDNWQCKVPGCSRAAEHLHHIWFKSRGGPSRAWNLVGLCAAHHLQGVHQGSIHISGRAPDGLTFLVGEEAVREARLARRGGLQLVA